MFGHLTGTKNKAHMLQLMNPMCLKPVLCNKRSPCNEWEARAMNEKPVQ